MQELVLLGVIVGVEVADLQLDTVENEVEQIVSVAPNEGSY
jgi:hypothetical protein